MRKTITLILFMFFACFLTAQNYYQYYYNDQKIELDLSTEEFAVHIKMEDMIYLKL